MKMGLNRGEVEEQVIEMINNAENAKERTGKYPRFKIDDVYVRLSIFDWWNDYLSVTQLKQMKKFLKIAHELGYDGYVCFKVGAVGCGNGMWAHKKESETGYSPDGEFLYHSFVTGEDYYDVKLQYGNFGMEMVGHELTLDEVKELIG